MLIKLLPDQIAKHWDTIRFGLIHSLPPMTEPTPEVLQNILRNLLIEKMQCWISFDQAEKDIYGVILTYVSVDPQSEYRTLIIYSLYVFSTAKRDIWEEGLRGIEEFAKASNCGKLAAYTAVPEIISIGEKLNFQTSYRYITKDMI